MRAERHAAGGRTTQTTGDGDMHIDFPFHFDTRQQTAPTTDDDHVRDLIEQLLFTGPGERVNRPNFGSGLQQLVFAGNSPELAATVQFLVQGDLQQYLGDVIEVNAVQVEAVDSALQVRVDYVVRRTSSARRRGSGRRELVAVSRTSAPTGAAATKFARSTS